VLASYRLFQRETSLEVRQRFKPLTVGGRSSDVRDVGIYFWRRQALDTLENAIRGAGFAGVTPVPILGSPDWLDTGQPASLPVGGRACRRQEMPHQ
jgi:hypothetical protein